MAQTSSPVAAGDKAGKLRGWRADLMVNARREGIGGLLVALIASPPFRAVTLVRLASFFAGKGAIGKVAGVLLARRLAHLFGCYISARARIGEALQLPHPTSIVIGDGCIVGDNVLIYQNVTLGLRSEQETGYPVIGDDVVIYAGAVIAGGITVGEGAVIGANSVVLADVPPHTVVAGAPARPIHRHSRRNEPAP